MTEWASGDCSFDWRGEHWDLRVEPGKKTTPRQTGPDLRLDLGIGGIYKPVPMPLSFLITDFYYANEERLYPQAAGYQGGEKFLDALRHSVQYGWTSATEELQREIFQKYGR